MRTIDDLAVRLAWGTLAVLAGSQLLAGCGAPEPATLGLAAPRLPDVDLAMFVAPPPDVEPEPAVQARDPRSGWCEPLDQAFCQTTADCSDGARCVTPWWAATGTETKVCARPMPTRSERRWRSDRLRVYVDHVCKRSDDCEPNDLHAYLRVMALRESTFRPWKRHRLNPDLRAASIALERNADVFEGNPAMADPDRWTSIGMLGQSPANWLQRWDPMAPPETLCGEVEAAEAHLRAARIAIEKIAEHKVDCDGDGFREYLGSACYDGKFPGGRTGCWPSWYDVSRVNSGSLCPGSQAHRDAFAARAHRVGLDPWAPVTPRDLGESIPRDGQDVIAAELRAKMDAVPMK